MSLRNIALSVALLFAFCGFALAQQIPQPPPYPSQGYYGQPASPTYQSPNWGNPAYQRGYQDGLKDGRSDWQDNHAYRPTGTEKYEDAPGYDSAYGAKNVYSQIYQEGYVYGYQVGYNGNAQPAYPPYGPVYAPPGPAYYANTPGYQTGFQGGLNDGQQDRESGQAYRAMATHNYEHTPGYDSSYGDKNVYKQAYREGYVAGYQQGFGMTAGYVPQAYPAYGYAYPPQSAYPTNQGYQIGYQEGVNDGRNDRVSGKAYRATKTEKYEDAPGYNKSFGDKNQYKEFYRQGYVAGYQAGFNGKVR